MRARRWMKRLGIGLGLLAVVLGILYLVLDEPVPTGERGPEADALAARIETAVDLDAWAETGAVRWTFAGRNRHLWDRRREVVRVQMGDPDDPDREVALLHLDGPGGRAYRGDTELTGDEARRVHDAAYAAFINDSFWLNPVAKFRDEGVELRSVDVDGEAGLLVTYTTGGLTPGDSYLWLVGPEGRPRAWRMWVSIIPIGGVETSWEGWQQLDTGAWISTRHGSAIGLTLTLDDVAGAQDLDALLASDGVAEDPFAPLFE